MTKEDKFFRALRDVFVGAKVEGESGYINLMKIKSRYYTEGVFPQLQKDIDAALEPFPASGEISSIRSAACSSGRSRNMWRLLPGREGGGACSVFLRQAARQSAPFPPA